MMIVKNTKILHPQGFFFFVLFLVVFATHYALAEPIFGPDLKNCKNAKIVEGVDVPCCPPKHTRIKDFEFPSPSEPLRIRRPAHLVDDAYIEKYERAVRLMKELPDSDPRSFKQQANVHCAYCNGAYNQINADPPVTLTIHFNWLFFPFHRYYLYFHERILGSLINDSTFALPFWNWDSPPGMFIPPIYTNSQSPLYDKIRNPKRRPSTVVKLNYDRSEDQPTPPAEQDGEPNQKIVDPGSSEQITENLKLMHRQMVEVTQPTSFFGVENQAGELNSQSRKRETPTLVERNHSLRDNPIVIDNLGLMKGKMVGVTQPSIFFGATNRAGVKPQFDPGSIELSPHNSLHAWTGTIRDPPGSYGENMGNFYSAGRDPVFFAHHSNIDRMWITWKNLGGGRRDPTDPDFLDAGFLFYDEHKNLVRVKVRDCLNITKLRYAYQEMDIEWKDFERTPKLLLKRMDRAAQPKYKLTPLTSFPIVLDKVVSVTVPRTKKKRSKKQKEEEAEVLVIQGIRFDSSEYVKFDVLINDDPDSPSSPVNSEFAGSFVSLAHFRPGEMEMTSDLSLDITLLLEELQAENDDSIVVTLVPKDCKNVSIDGLKIHFVRG